MKSQAVFIESKQEWDKVGFRQCRTRIDNKEQMKMRKYRVCCSNSNVWQLMLGNKEMLECKKQMKLNKSLPSL